MAAKAPQPWGTHAGQPQWVNGEGDAGHPSKQDRTPGREQTPMWASPEGLGVEGATSAVYQEWLESQGPECRNRGDRKRAQILSI